MPSTLSRTRFGAAVAAAFVGGVLVASSLDFTHFGYAQGTQAAATAKPVVQQIRPTIDGGNAFVAIAEHVTPAVVAIQTVRDPRESDNASPRMRGRVPPGLEDFFNQFGPQRPVPQEASGSGLIVIRRRLHPHQQSRGRLTPKHYVTLQDEREFNAKVIGKDPRPISASSKSTHKDLAGRSLGDSNTLTWATG